MKSENLNKLDEETEEKIKKAIFFLEIGETDGELLSQMTDEEITRAFSYDLEKEYKEYNEYMDFLILKYLR